MADTICAFPWPRKWKFLIHFVKYGALFQSYGKENGDDGDDDNFYIIKLLFRQVSAQSCRQTKMRT